MFEFSDSVVLPIVNVLLTWSMREGFTEEAFACWLCPQGGSHGRVSKQVVNAG